MKYWTAFLAIALLAGAWSDAVAADWPQWRGANRDGISSETGWLTTWPEEGPKVLWKAQVGTGFSAVSVADGRAYTMGWADGKDTVWCFDAADGRVLWKHSYRCVKGSHPGPRVTPTVDAKEVYTVSREGFLVCFDAATGEVRWSKNIFESLGGEPPKWGYACSPLILANRLILETGAKGSSVVALDKTTGRLLWKSGTEQLGYSSPVAYSLGGKRFLAVFTAKALLGLRADDGRPLWRHPWEMWRLNTTVTPIISGDRVFVSSAYGGGALLLEIHRPEPKVVWQHTQMQNHFSTCVLWKGYLYGIDGDRGKKGVLKCLDFASGEVKWSKEGIGKGQLILVDGRLLIQAERGEVIVAVPSPEGYKELARAKVLDGQCWTTPVLSGGRIYCRNTRGDLVCLDVGGN